MVYEKNWWKKKISVKTKPTKKVTYYAQWKRVLNSDEQKLVGEWRSAWDGSSVYKFYSNGTYFSVSSFKQYDWGFIGYYSVKNAKLTLTYQNAKDYTGVGFNSKSLVWMDWETSGPYTLEFDTSDGNQYFRKDGGMWYKKVS